MILLLHTLIEAIIGLLFLFYADAGEIVPGFADGLDTRGHILLMKMYGLAALFLAGLSLVAYLKRREVEIVNLIVPALAAFHYGMLLIQFIYNSDHRAGLLHFLLAILLTARYTKKFSG